MCFNRRQVSASLKTCRSTAATLRKGHAATLNVPVDGNPDSQRRKCYSVKERQPSTSLPLLPCLLRDVFRILTVIKPLPRLEQNRSRNQRHVCGKQWEKRPD